MQEECCSYQAGDCSEPCCSASAKTERAPLCPQCGKRGKWVGNITLANLLKADAKEQMQPDRYLFCEIADCPVVYYSKSGGETFCVDEILVPVTQKSEADSTPVCYCFHHTRGSIRDEIERTGRSTVVAQISAAVKDGRCECEIRNPQGACCLGNVSRAVKDAWPRVVKSR